MNKKYKETMSNKYLTIDRSEVITKKSIESNTLMLERFCKFKKYSLQNSFYSTYNINRTKFPYTTICQIRIGKEDIYCEVVEKYFEETRILFDTFSKINKIPVTIKVE